jgi:hypothetical protein
LRVSRSRGRISAPRRAAPGGCGRRRPLPNNGDLMDAEFALDVAAAPALHDVDPGARSP